MQIMFLQNAIHFHQFHLNLDRICNELKNLHFHVLDWRQLLFHKAIKGRKSEHRPLGNDKGENWIGAEIIISLRSEPRRASHQNQPLERFDSESQVPSPLLLRHYAFIWSFFSSRRRSAAIGSSSWAALLQTLRETSTNHSPIAKMNSSVCKSSSSSFCFTVENKSKSLGAKSDE
jgi:hypothetical protein